MACILALKLWGILKVVFNSDCLKFVESLKNNLGFVNGMQKRLSSWRKQILESRLFYAYTCKRYRSSLHVN